MTEGDTPGAGRYPAPGRGRDDCTRCGEDLNDPYDHCQECAAYGAGDGLWTEHDTDCSQAKRGGGQ